MKSIAILRNVAVTVLTAVCVSSSFASVNLGTLTKNGTLFSGAHFVGSFSDIFSFNLSTSSTVGGFAMSTGIEPFTVSLDNGVKDFNPFDGFNFGVLSAGSHTLTFSGLASGFGFYGGAVQAIAAVPEPQTFAMLLVGLGVMGAIARRRKV